jgi:hypothetical protein
LGGEIKGDGSADTLGGPGDENVFHGCINRADKTAFEEE